MKTCALIGIALVASLATASSASAEKPVWKSIAMACVPTSETVANGVYVTSAGRVKHEPGKLGTISFVCHFYEALSVSSQKQYRLRAYVNRVSNHPAVREYATATLRAARDKTGEVVTVLETENDNFLSSNEPMVQIFSQPKLIAWSADFTYYVQLTITRDTIRTSVGVEQIPEILSVELLEN